MFDEFFQKALLTISILAFSGTILFVTWIAYMDEHNLQATKKTSQHCLYTLRVVRRYTLYTNAKINSDLHAGAVTSG